ncbi:MAG: alkaline phosphatase family protein [Candidatus Sumerlaeia bacterium]|nr:alkaline phosphatase family protein [Candidatus Sumerlaeia bacterium]
MSEPQTIMKMFRTPLLIIGLDGASPEWIRRWTQSGDLPNLAGLMTRGVFAPLVSTIPPISPTAWSTFMTGLQPGSHGVLGFRNVDARRYEYHEPDIITSARVAGRTFWDVAGAHGLRVAALWVPVTYPPWKVNGLLVSGYPTPSEGRSFTYPENRAADIPCLTENSAFFRSAGKEAVAAELLRLARERGRVAADLIRRSEFDLFVMVIGSIDHAQHRYWHYCDPAHPVYDVEGARALGDTIRNTYRAADAAVGEMLAAAGPDANVIVMSDHGAGPAASRLLHLNAWLRERGLLEARRPALWRRIVTAAYRWARDRIAAKEQIYRALPRALRSCLTRFDAGATFGVAGIVWPRTRAFRFPLHVCHQGIVINLKGRQPQGCVEPADYEPLRGQLIRELMALRDPLDGRAVVVSVRRREEVYQGTQIEALPDLIVETAEGYACGSQLWSAAITPTSLRRLRSHSGNHRCEGILIAAGPAIRRGAELSRPSIADLAPTALSLLGVPVPASMEGRILGQILVAPPEADRKTMGEPAAPPPATVAEGAFSPDEQDSIAAHLKTLGYMD